MPDTFVTLARVKDFKTAQAIRSLLRTNDIEVNVWPVSNLALGRPVLFRHQCVTVSEDDLPEASRLLRESGLPIL
jgi:uncharacterized protein involved in type VI secretion and phage assembly